MNSDKLTEAQQDRLIIWQIRHMIEPAPFWETMERTAPLGLLVWPTQWAMVAMMRLLAGPMLWLVKHTSRAES